MELALFKALSSIKIEEPLVEAVIKAMDTHIDAGVSKSVIPILAKLDGLSAKLDAYAAVKSEQQLRTRWIVGTVIGAAGLTVAAAGTTVAVLKALGYL